MTDSITSGNFTFRRTKLSGVIVVETKVFADARGAFRETYKKADFAAGGIACDFVQDNQSVSRKGVIRGLHFQRRFPQAKLVRVACGRIFDVALDLRPESPTFGAWEGVELSEANGREVFIPQGFAHGFRALSDTAVVIYQCDEVWHPEDEGGIRWDDPTLDIAWPAVDGEAAFDPATVIVSAKDAGRPGWTDVAREAGMP